MIQAAIVNKLIEATNNVGEQLIATRFETGKPSVVQSALLKENVCILVGTTGALRGQVILSFDRQTGLDLSNRIMQGFGSGEWDDMSRSALQEFGNMIMGSFATLLSSENITIDITPPSLVEGDNIQIVGEAGIKVPLRNGDNEVFLTTMLKS